MRNLPVVAIVGRPNVGKSSLLNAMVGKRISIVQDMPGVTRDRVSYPFKVGDRYVELVDTGGYGFVDPDALTEHIRQQIELAMTQAQLVLFIVDCQAGLTSADVEIANLLRRKGIKTVILANKADSPKADVALGDFARLGMGTPLGVSAKTDRNVERIIEVIQKNVDLSQAPMEVPEPQMLVAIVGKRNAGKSTLVNAVAELYEEGAERVIVSEVPGTTRDSVDVRFEKDGKAMIVIDTAGVRKKRHMVTNDIEFYSFHRAQRSIRRADIVFLLIDGSEHVSEPDQKLAQYIAEQHKPVVIIINKWDKVLAEADRQAKAQENTFSPDLLMTEYREYLSQELRHLDYVPVLYLTARDGKKVQAALDAAQRLFNQANDRVTTGRLNEVLRQIMEERGPTTPTGRRPKVYYATQTDVAPPTIVLFVNRPEYFKESYQRYLVNRFRQMLPFPEVPIRLMVRGKEGVRKPSEAEGDARVIRRKATPRSEKRSSTKRPTKPRRKPSQKGVR